MDKLIRQQQFAYFEQCAQTRQWEALLAHAENVVCLPSNVLGHARWHALALRSLGRGSDANAVLSNAMQQPFEATVGVTTEFAEDLNAAGHYELVARLAERLELFGAVHAHYLWCIYWREREDWAKAEASLAHIANVRTGRWPMTACLQGAWCALRQGNPSKAMELLQPVSELPNPHIQKLLARVELALGSFQLAAQRLNKVSTQIPDDWEWPTLLAAAQSPALIQAHPDAILRGYALGLRRQPSQADAHINVARLHQMLRNGDQAINHLHAALLIKPWMDAPVLLQLEWLLAAGDAKQALAVADTALARHITPRRMAARLDVLRSINKGAFEALASEARAAIQKYPTHSQVLRSAGALLQTAKMLDEAASVYEAARTLDPDDVGTANNLAVLYRDRGDHDQAINLWRSVLPRADVTVRLSYAHALLGRGGRLEAESIFSRVLDAQPEHASALRGMASVRRQAGQVEAALALVARALQVDEGNASAWVLMAELQAQLGHFTEAEQTLQNGLLKGRPALPVRQALFKLWRANQPPHEIFAKVRLWPEIEPGEVEHWLMAADAAVDALEFEDAERNVLHASRINNTIGGTALVRYFLQRGRHDAARNTAEHLVQREPHVMKHWGLLAEVCYRQNCVDEALDVLAKALEQEPGRLSLIRQRLGILLAQERYTQAIAEAKALYNFRPDSLGLSLYTEALRRAHRFEDCVSITGSAYERNPHDLTVAMAHVSALRRAQRYAAAENVLSKLRTAEPDNLEVLKSQVKLLGQLDRLDEAVVVMQAFAKTVPDKPDVLLMLARKMRESGSYDEVQSVLCDAISHHPGHLELQVEQAQLLTEINQADAARRAWQRIAERHHICSWCGVGLRHWVTLGMENALEAELEAWSIKEPTNPQPLFMLVKYAGLQKKYLKQFDWIAKLERLTGPTIYVLSTRASLLSEAWKMTAAIQCQRNAIKLSPAEPSLHLGLLNFLVKAGDFDEFDELYARINQLWGDARYAQHANMFFNINCHPSWSAKDIANIYSGWYEHAVKPNMPPVKPWQNLTADNRRLRIGYLSPDFRRHAVAYFSEPLLIEHERNAFELYAYAEHTESVDDAYTARFKSYVHHWRNTKNMADDELERVIRADGIDILIDLAGHTAGNRLNVMLRRPAPVQATWIWGAGQTTGLSEINYFLSDASSCPPEHTPCMAEQVLCLPEVGLPYMPPSDILEPTPLPCSQTDEVILGVVARPVRTNRLTMRVWAQILLQAPKTRLRFDHMPYAEPDIQQRVTAMFAEHGIGPERLSFSNTRPHWQAYDNIDLLLDTFPAGSGTTVTEGLLMERLAVTLESRPVMGRIPGAQLRALGLEDACVAQSEDEYIAKAVALASNPKKLVALSGGLRKKVQSSSLMDYSGYAQSVSVLYRQMWQAWCQQQKKKQQ